MTSWCSEDLPAPARVGPGEHLKKSEPATNGQALLQNLAFHCKQPAPLSFISAATEPRFRGTSGKISHFLGPYGGGKCQLPAENAFLFKSINLRATGLNRPGLHMERGGSHRTCSCLPSSPQSPRGASWRAAGLRSCFFPKSSP